MRYRDNRYSSLSEQLKLVARNETRLLYIDVIINVFLRSSFPRRQCILNCPESRTHSVNIVLFLASYLIHLIFKTWGLSTVIHIFIKTFMFPILGTSWLIHNTNLSYRRKYLSIIAVALFLWNTELEFVFRNHAKNYGTRRTRAVRDHFVENIKIHLFLWHNRLSKSLPVQTKKCCF